MLRFLKSGDGFPVFIFGTVLSLWFFMRGCLITSGSLICLLNFSSSICRRVSVWNFISFSLLVASCSRFLWSYYYYCYYVSSSYESKLAASSFSLFPHPVATPPPTSTSVPTAVPFGLYWENTVFFLRFFLDSLEPSPKVEEPPPPTGFRVLGEVCCDCCWETSLDMTKTLVFLLCVVDWFLLSSVV